MKENMNAGESYLSDWSDLTASPGNQDKKLEEVIKDIKEQLYNSLKIAKSNLHEIKMSNNYREFESEVKSTEENIILTISQYAINKFKINKIEKPLSTLYGWIVDEVTSQLIEFTEIERGIENSESFY
jgi:hypothetical protein